MSLKTINEGLCIEDTIEINSILYKCLKSKAKMKCIGCAFDKFDKVSCRHIKCSTNDVILVKTKLDKK